MSTEVYLDQILFVGFFALVICAALSDISAFRIPNKISLGLIALYPPHLLLSPVPVDWMRAFMVAGITFVVGFILFARGLVGAGDVKLLSATALWAGRPLIGTELVIMALAGGLLAVSAMLIQIVRRYRAEGLIGMLTPAGAAASAAPSPKLPYGVAIAAGALYVGAQLMAS